MVSSLTVILPIVFYTMLLVIGKKTKEFTEQQKRVEKESLDKKIDEIYQKERMGYYHDVHCLFGQLIKAGKIGKVEISKIKKMINDSLGCYVRDYRGKKYKNDIHEIYSKMKSKHIDKKEWVEILEYLNELKGVEIVEVVESVDVQQEEKVS
jgi:hypothetical protein